VDVQEFELSVMSQHFLDILNIHEPGGQKRCKIGYRTTKWGGQTSNVHAKKARLTQLAFGSLSAHEMTMAKEGSSQRDENMTWRSDI
jgi:hypothetical protein